VEGSREKVAEKIRELVAEKKKSGYVTAVLCDSDNMELYSGDLFENVYDAGSKKNEITVSAALYSLLRTCDDIGAQYIYTESFKDGDMGYAIMNRLLKAAGHRVVSV
jgi:L-threonylcarbamoyladenylate synthase